MAFMGCSRRCNKNYFAKTHWLFFSFILKWDTSEFFNGLRGEKVGLFFFLPVATRLQEPAKADVQFEFKSWI